MCLCYRNWIENLSQNMSCPSTLQENQVNHISLQFISNGGTTPRSPPKKTVYFNTNMTCSEQLPAFKGPFSCAMSGKLIQVDFTVFATDPPFNHQPSHTMTAVYPFSISCIKHIIKILKMRTGHNPYENWTDRMLVVCRHTLLFNIHYNEQKNSKNKESKFSTCFTLISAVSLTA